MRDKQDTRCVRIKLTQKGAEYARWCDIDFEMIYTTMMETFNADEREGAVNTINEMNRSLTGLKERLEG